MNEPRFQYEEVIIPEEFDEATDELVSFISPQIKDNGVIIYDGKNAEDVESICAVLNKVHDENLKLRELVGTLLDYYRKCPIAMTREEFQAFKNLKDMGL